LYPNPVDNGSFLNLRASGSEKKQLTIVDLNGKLVLSNTFQNQKRINTNLLKSGIYIVSVESAFGHHSQKLIVK